MIVCLIGGWMKKIKVDRRVQYTKMVLRESLTNLMKEKPVSRITIKEICEHADINRTTFYSHYSDQFDLLKKIEQGLIDDINDYLDQFVYLENAGDSLQMMTKIFEYIEENADICRVLLGSNGDIEFQKDIMKIVHQRCVLEWVTKTIPDKRIADYLYAFLVTGSIGMIQKWLGEEDKKSAKEMARLVMALSNDGLNAFL